MERLQPEEILKKIQNDEEKQLRGHLKIFFGYAAGVGKTYAMLEAAPPQAQNVDIDVVVGILDLIL